MSGLKNTVKRLANASVGRGYMTNKERKEKKKAKRQAALNKIYEGAEMPDPEQLQAAERKRAAGRRGSRASTVLTGRDTLG